MREPISFTPFSTAQKKRKANEIEAPEQEATVTGSYHTENLTGLMKDHIYRSTAAIVLYRIHPLAVPSKHRLC